MKLEALERWALAHIARPRPGITFVPQIDGLRFVAIMAVVLYHTQGYVEAKAGLQGVQQGSFLHGLFGVGHFGVPLFFAISGYIIARPFLGKARISLRRYFLRRLTRLEPPYLINLLLIFVVKLWVLEVAFPDFFPHLLASAIYAHGPIYGTHSLVNGVAWSLEVEWQFYLLAPVLFWILSRIRAAPARHLGLAGAILVGSLVYPAGFEDSRLGLSIARYSAFFLVGIWAALIDEEGRWASVEGWVFDVIGIMATLLTLGSLLAGQQYTIALPALTALVLVCSLRGTFLGKLLSWWPVHCIGAMCYSTYLYHFFVISMAGYLFAAWFDWPASPSFALIGFALFAVPATLAACALPYILFERPFMVWRPGSNRLKDAVPRIWRSGASA